ncbi:MAG TPA: hypothetical protein VHZ75_00520 [Solirubrobacteraceae bacterium]|jgi:hypothetical protein|nr:hypothetical protein [Solirubrobacteraceae bacterium]
MRPSWDSDPAVRSTPGHGPIRLRTDRCCTSHACLRPARELGGLCSHCWRGATPETRAILRWEAELGAPSTTGFDIVAAAEAILRRSG